MLGREIDTHGGADNIMSYGLTQEDVQLSLAYGNVQYIGDFGPIKTQPVPANNIWRIKHITLVTSCRPYLPADNMQYVCHIIRPNITPPNNDFIFDSAIAPSWMAVSPLIVNAYYDSLDQPTLTDSDYLEIYFYNFSNGYGTNVFAYITYDIYQPIGDQSTVSYSP